MRRLPDFQIASPSSVEEACRVRAQFPDTSTFYAGGTELLLAMKLGVVAYDRLIDLKKVDELRSTDIRADAIEIGAGVTHREVEESAAIRSRLPVLSNVAARIGNIRVRSSGTIGGNLAFAEPRSDIATLGVCLDWHVELASATARRWLTLEEFLVGPYETRLRDDEVLTRVRMKPLGEYSKAFYDKFQFHERPTVSVGLAVELQEGEITRCRIAVGSAVPIPTRRPLAEREAIGPQTHFESRRESVLEAATSDLELADDLEGGADYKAHLVHVMLGRLLDCALAQQAP